MKRVLQIEPDTNFRFMYSVDDYDVNDWKFNGESRIGNIKRFQAQWAQDSNKPIPDISYINTSTFAISKKVATELVELWEDSAELIPFDVNDELWYLLNVINRQENILDVDNSEFMVPVLNVGIEKAVFYPDKLPRSCIFKIPEGRYSETFCVDSRVDDEDIMNNLFCAIQGHGYTGLIFKEVASYKV
ncbi:hypothetical protein DU002_14245 [Corallincola holothuriorum]|uniref:Uncharacterized protein n=1 Tax=Corallincola holothuriorum TaxID=2282215 RepID=A0A368N4Z2_9GAMM|nr:hypothetical protein [Corallincola holothuriorum]RCU45622.1 hypothetical protein DU002_14245 [Corallincola holothuriorum]